MHEERCPYRKGGVPAAPMAWLLFLLLQELHAIIGCRALKKPSEGIRKALSVGVLFVLYLGMSAGVFLSSSVLGSAGAAAGFAAGLAAGAAAGALAGAGAACVGAGAVV